MTPRRRAWRLLEGGALGIGLLCLGLWLHAQWESWAFQATAEKGLGAAARAAAQAAPARAASADGVLGKLVIPRLRIQAIVAEGTDRKTLGRAVGHIRSTALPGDRGNCALAGHRDTFLRGLGDVRVNDVIRIVTRERTYHYVVEWSEVVAPDRVDTLDPTETPAVTLVTCYPFEFIGRAPQRFVVRARQVEAEAAPAALQGHVALPSRAWMAKAR